MKILLFGGFGLLGQDIYSSLKKSDCEVIRFRSNDLDLLNFEQLTLQLDQIKPDCIINAAGFTDVNNAELAFKEAFDGNVRTVYNLLKWLDGKNVKLVHFSTDYIFNGGQSNPYTESDIANPLNKYGWTKFLSEQIIALNYDKYYIVRTSWLFGSGGNCFPKRILSKLIAGERISVVNDQIGSPTYTLDLADIILPLLKAPYGIYNFANEGSVSWYDYSKKIAELAGLENVEGRIEPIQTATTALVKRPKYSVLDTANIEKALGIKIRNYQDALADFIGIEK